MDNERIKECLEGTASLNHEVLGSGSGSCKGRCRKRIIVIGGQNIIAIILFLLFVFQVDGQENNPSCVDSLY